RYIPQQNDTSLNKPRAKIERSHLTPPYSILPVWRALPSHNASLFEKEKNKNELNCTSAIGDLYVKTCNGKMEIEKRKEKIELIKQLQLFGDR
ncbi:hypothetical protein OFN46_26630, partial [Escherichia coli]|nr:hypothetical protein [Escherichia coli]